MQLYAVRIFAHDWDHSCAFYRDTLQLQERFRDDEIGWAEYDVGGPCLGLERTETTDEEALVGRFVGVSLQVADIDATYRAMLARGVTFTSAPAKQLWGGKLAHFADPNGNVLTLIG